MDVSKIYLISFGMNLYQFVIFIMTWILECDYHDNKFQAAGYYERVEMDYSFLFGITITFSEYICRYSYFALFYETHQFCMNTLQLFLFQTKFVFNFELF